MQVAGRTFKRWQIITAIVGLVVIVGGGLLFSTFNSIQKTGVTMSTALGAQFSDNENELSNYISTFFEQTGVAKVKAAKLNQILLDAVKGRYDGASAAKAAPAGSMGRGSPFFSAVFEAYPDLTGLDIYNKIADFVQSGRQAYKDKQSKLLDMLRAFDTWRRSGIIHSWLVDIAGVPGHDLQARIGTTILYGTTAEAKMYDIVLTGQAKDAYTSGTMAPLVIPS